jgi:hypothetical protein
MQPNTFAPNAFTGTPAQAKTHLNSFPADDRVLILSQKDLQAALPDGSTAIAETLEDWLAMLLYHAIDKAANTPKTERRFNCIAQGIGLDTGSFQTGKVFYVRTVTTSFYSEAASLNGKPSLGDF